MNRRRPRPIERTSNHKASRLPEPEPTVLETEPRAHEERIDGFCRQPPPPSTIRELNFDDVQRAAKYRNGPPCHATKREIDALLEPPAQLADFLLDRSLLPKRPPCATRSS